MYQLLASVIKHIIRRTKIKINKNKIKLFTLNKILLQNLWRVLENKFREFHK